MDMRYQQFCLADRRFYDLPERVASRHGRFALADAEPPSGWSAAESDGWSHRYPHDPALPPQGWKLHVSTTLDQAERVLDMVFAACIERGLAFKFLSSAQALSMRNAKYADRAGSGKFITIYPPTDDSAVESADALDTLLGGTPGPYILSDLRWNSGPVFTRYGAFQPRFCLDARGERVPAIENPQGTLEPDSREPRFTPPPWLTLPDAMRRQLETLGTGAAPDGFRYLVEEPLHFSNGGGVYLARDTRTGRRVVLKEARPHAGLDPSGRAAPERLHSEAAFIRRLADEPSVVGWVESFDLLEHHFLAEEFVEGQTLNKAITSRYPLIRGTVEEDELREYTDWALGVLDQVTESLCRLHSRGIVFGDLHPNNMILTPDGRVVLIDLETAHETTKSGPPLMGAPGYVAPDGREGVARDRYGLGCLRLAMFFPLNSVLPFDPSKIYQYLRFVERTFPVTGEFRASVLSDLGLAASDTDEPSAGLALVTEWAAAHSPPVGRLVDDMAAAVLSDATPERTDRLYPGDITQFTENGLGLAHGAAGVLVTLGRAGVDIPDVHLEWFATACRDPERFGPHVGLYDGSGGAALALLDLGMPDEARSVAAPLLASDPAHFPDHLYGGLAGLGLVHLALAHATRDEQHMERALDSGRLLRSRARLTPQRSASVSASGPGARAGLMWGRAGHTLLHCALFEATGDDDHLDAARAAVSYDLAACVRVPADGSLQVDEGWRVLPYLASGSAGIGLAILRLRQYVQDTVFESALEGIHAAASPRFIIGAGQLNGRAGLVEFLLSARDAGFVDPATNALVGRHLRDLSWHAITDGTGIAVMGDQLLRLSHDLGTGTAGVIHALRRAAAPAGSLTGYLPLLDFRVLETAPRKEVMM
jgi:hypothetical protein